MPDWKALVVRNIGLGPVLNRKCQLRGLRQWPALVRHERWEAHRAPFTVSAPCVTLIPTVGRPSLAAAVDSALNQSLRGNVVVVVTDGPCELPSLAEEVRVIKTSRNCGVVGVVRNIGLRCTRSAAVAFLDDDNTWRPNHLEVSMAALETADVVYGSAVRHRPGGAVYDTVGGPWNRSLIARANYVDASAIVVRRLPGVRFSRVSRVGDQFSEDWELLYRLSRRHRVAWTGEATIDYQIGLAFLGTLESLGSTASHPVDAVSN